jgi:DegV family protein with EDD domain
MLEEVCAMSKKVILTADSTCDLSAELVERYGVVILPLHVVLDDAGYDDGVDIQPDDIYRTYGEKKILPKTAAVSMGEFLEFFTPYVEQGCEVVHINLGSGLSATHNNARLAAAELEGVYVVDSCNLSTGSGLLVIEAANRVAAGLSAQQIASEVQSLASKVSASFVLDTLEFLHKGGRCSSLAMMGANMLQLKPCIEVDNTSGKMGVGKKYRGALDKCLQQYVKDRLEGHTDICTNHIFITHSGISEERIALVKAEIEKYLSFDEIFITRAGCTVSSHCGPNTLGILYMTK